MKNNVFFSLRFLYFVFCAGCFILYLSQIEQNVVFSNEQLNFIDDSNYNVNSENAKYLENLNRDSFMQAVYSEESTVFCEQTSGYLSSSRMFERESGEIKGKTSSKNGFFEENFISGNAQQDNFSFSNDIFQNETQREASVIRGGVPGLSTLSDATGKGVSSVSNFLGFSGISSCRVRANIYDSSGRIRPKNRLKMREVMDGLQAGFDLELNSSVAYYINYNYNKGLVENRFNKDNIENNMLGVGYKYNPQGFYFLLMGTYGLDKYTANQFSSDLVPSSLDYEGWQASGYFETGFEMSGGMFDFYPFTGFLYGYLKHDELDRAAMTLCDDREVSYNSVQSLLGGKIKVSLGGILALQFRTVWVHHMKKNVPLNTCWYTQSYGTYLPLQLTYEGNRGLEYCWVGTGMRMSLFGIADAGIYYDCLFNKYQENHIGSASIGFRW